MVLNSIVISPNHNKTYSTFYFSVLSWLKEHPPLTNEQLKDLFITMDDFQVNSLTYSIAFTCKGEKNTSTPF